MTSVSAKIVFGIPGRSYKAGIDYFLIFVSKVIRLSTTNNNSIKKKSKCTVTQTSFSIVTFVVSVAFVIVIAVVL